MGERQWGRRADDREPGADPRVFSLPLRQVPPPEEASSSRQGRHASDRGGQMSTIADLITDFMEAAEDGVALDPHGQPYTVEVLRSHRRGLSYVDAELGVMAIQDVRRRDVQGLVTQLSASGLAPARVLAVVDSLGALYSYAIRRDLVDFSPVVELQLPEVEGAVASPLPPETPPPFPTADLPQPSYPSLPPVVGMWPPHPYLPPGGSWPPPGFMTPGDAGTPPPYMTPGGSWPPPGFMAPGDPGTPPPFLTSGGTWPPHVGPGYASGPPMVHAQSNGTGSGSYSAMFGAPGAPGPDANYDATMQERWLWWTVRIIVIVFVLIALVLAAESV